MKLLLPESMNTLKNIPLPTTNVQSEWIQLLRLSCCSLPCSVKLRPTLRKSTRTPETRQEHSLTGQNICLKSFLVFICWCQWLSWSTFWLPWCLILISEFRYLNLKQIKRKIKRKRFFQNPSSLNLDLHFRHNLTLSGSLVYQNWSETCTEQRLPHLHSTLSLLGLSGLLNFVG